MHKKRPKICTACRELAQLKFTYIITIKIAKARPHRVECPTDSSVQKQWSMHRPMGNSTKGNKLS